MGKKKKYEIEDIKEKTGRLPNEIKGLIYILIAILGFLRAGVVGEKIFGAIAIFLFGAFFRIIFIFIFYIGLYYIIKRERPKYFSRKYIGGYALFTTLLLFTNIHFIMHNVNIGNSVIRITLESIKYNSYATSENIFIRMELWGGGFFGALYSYLSVVLFDIIGSRIVMVVLVLFSFAMIFDKSILNLITHLFKKKDKDEEENKKVISDIDEVLNKEKQNTFSISDNIYYKLPPIDILENPKKINTKTNESSVNSSINLIQKTLSEFDIEGKVVAVHVGPTVTQFELEIKAGTKVSRLLAIDRELALALSAKSVKIQAPIFGKNTVGIEIPNKVFSIVTLKEVLTALPEATPSNRLTVALGKNIMGEPIWMEINNTPHLLIAGATGSGKSVCINSIIISLLMRTKPDEVKLVLVDPKKVELSIYNGIPHLLSPVVTDPRKASVVLKKIIEEMEKRYEIFTENEAKDIVSYNKYVMNKNMSLPDNEKLKPIPYIVVIIDELADLMLVAAKEVEDSIMRITQMARAAGIHLIAATQRPSTEVITGIVKSNIPSRISFAVSSQIDSRTILDKAGAEKLLGKGDMLFIPMGEGIPLRVQGTYVSEEEIKKVVNYTIGQQKAQYDTNLLAVTDKQQLSTNDYQEEYEEPLYNEIVEFIIKTKKVSASLLQRKYRLGYNRAARIIDLLEERGIIGPPNGAKPRDVLVTLKDDKENDEE